MGEYEQGEIINGQPAEDYALSLLEEFAQVADGAKVTAYDANGLELWTRSREGEGGPLTEDEMQALSVGEVVISRLLARRDALSRR